MPGFMNPVAFGSNTMAAQAMLGRRGKSTGSRKKRRGGTAKRGRKAASASGRSRGKKKPARLVKGSAAAKRYMASIRKKRK